MARMLSKAYEDRGRQPCGYGCCRAYQLVGHGGRRDPRVRRWARASDNRAWRREVARGEA